MMSLEILGIGTAAPEYAIEQPDAARMAQSICGDGFDQQRLLPALYRRTGIRQRHSVLLTRSTNGTPSLQSFYPAATDGDDEGPTTADRMKRYEHDAPLLAGEAATEALGEAGCNPRDITHLVTVSCSGFSAPGFDIALIRELGLPRTVARTHIGYMGCHGALNGLRVARSFAEADPSARVLLCAVELCSLHQQYGWKKDQIVANALFADGAAAIVGRAGPPAEPRPWCLTASGSMLLPETEELMSWRVRDHGFEMTLSPRVPDVIRCELEPWLNGWLVEQRLSIETVGSWAVHPGGRRVLDACADVIGLNSTMLDPSREIFAEFGNMSSPTVLFILKSLRDRQAKRPCVMLGFGPGLTIEAALIR